MVTQTSFKSASWQNPKNRTEETYSYTSERRLFPRRPNKALEHFLHSGNSIWKWKQTWSTHQQNRAVKILQIPLFLSCFILHFLYSEKSLLKSIEIESSTSIKKHYQYLCQYQKRYKRLHLKTLDEKKIK